eukprot:416448-Rhodomonas_salina.1
MGVERTGAPLVSQLPRLKLVLIPPSQHPFASLAPPPPVLLVLTSTTTGTLFQYERGTKAWVHLYQDLEGEPAWMRLAAKKSAKGGGMTQDEWQGLSCYVTETPLSYAAGTLCTWDPVVLCTRYPTVLCTATACPVLRARTRYGASWTEYPVYKAGGCTVPESDYDGTCRCELRTRTVSSAVLALVLSAPQF